jgi:hypothetical protein
MINTTYHGRKVENKLKTPLPAFPAFLRYKRCLDSLAGPSQIQCFPPIL